MQKYKYRIRIMLIDGGHVTIWWNHTMPHNEGEEEYPRYQFNTLVREAENDSYLYILKDNFGKRPAKVRVDNIKEIVLERRLSTPEEYMHDIIKDLK